MVIQALIVQRYNPLAPPFSSHESRGAQAHEDYPDRDDKNFMKHTLSWQKGSRYVEEAKIELTYRPVIDQPLDSEMHHVPPAKRVY